LPFSGGTTSALLWLAAPQDTTWPPCSKSTPELATLCFYTRLPLTCAPPPACIPVVPQLALSNPHHNTRHGERQGVCRVRDHTRASLYYGVAMGCKLTCAQYARRVPQGGYSFHEPLHQYVDAPRFQRAPLTLCRARQEGVHPHFASCWHWFPDHGYVVLRNAAKATETHY
jgi:hypothetical protein